jgi:hypothetical protein
MAKNVYKVEKFMWASWSKEAQSFHNSIIRTARLMSRAYGMRPQPARRIGRAVALEAGRAMNRETSPAEVVWQKRSG